MNSVQEENDLLGYKISTDPFWDSSEERERKMHKIHSYPARFPSLITTKSLEYAKQHSIQTKRVADIFCGCGTVAYEARRANIDFWGCDINPVATVIAKVKSHKYQTGRLRKYYSKILVKFDSYDRGSVEYENAIERLKYWYDKEHYTELFLLRKAIYESLPPSGHYRLFFLCAFSNILKGCSRWLTKSIKPQRDPNKVPSIVIDSFKQQYSFMEEANEESDLSNYSEVSITTDDVKKYKKDRPKVDLIITSPPYVTSYDYGDIHQLSTLWLEFAEDYRSLRKDAIGSKYQESAKFGENLEQLNITGREIVLELYPRSKSKARDVAKYYFDMQQVARIAFDMLNNRGMAIFVIGDTEYKGVKIRNSKHLLESLKDSGFTGLTVSKRKIKSKIMTPYRDEIGRFTRDTSKRKIYTEEFIIIGVK